ncbi:hypothetical protein L204_105552 [Cryptococcus depauperatus]|nr:hypothetical protein L204_02677 [Cryptococcus depauperatus CBS 7855]
MYETTVGYLSTRLVDRERTETCLEGRNRDQVGETEELESQYPNEEDMAELSDSPSSSYASSRPVTPSHPASVPVQISGTQSSSKIDVFKLADKAEKILGLTPGTLAYAQACLQNARDEVRRTAPTSSSETFIPLVRGSDGKSHLDMGRGRLKERMTERAKKAMSVTVQGVMSQQKMASVVLGGGGKEEEERREKRRKAADGVLYWQREVARLEEDAQKTQITKTKR